jgi:2'-5' RNA ligase
MRLFLAITIPETVKLALAKFQEHLQSPFLIGNWVGHEQFHVTLKFLGRVSEPQRESLHTVMESYAEQQAPFEIHIDELSVFPNLVVPQMLWLGAHSPKLVRIGNELESLLFPLGFPKEKRDFQGHVTLARLKRGRIKPIWLEERLTYFVPQSFPVKKITLYESETTPKGPEYHAVEHFRFQRVEKKGVAMP